MAEYLLPINDKCKILEIRNKMVDNIPDDFSSKFSAQAEGGPRSPSDNIFMAPTHPLGLSLCEQ